VESIESTIGEYTISSDPDRLDLGVIHDYLSNESYWAAGRTMETVERSVAASLNVGAYAPDGSMVGAARVVTDGITFGWLCDVFVLQGHRGRGLGVALVRAAIEHPELRDLKRMILATGDAHSLYERFGFEPLGDESGRWMVKRGPAA
jgi:GNAT superfamily N-acetyltransferase